MDLYLLRLSKPVKSLNLMMCVGVRVSCVASYAVVAF